MRLDLPGQGSGGGGYTIQENAVSQNGQTQESNVNQNRRSSGRGHRLDETIAGFVLYRLENGVVEYLLMKKVRQNDWSPPKGHVENNEDSFEGAEREVLEETNLSSAGDYEVLKQYPIYFEYKTRQRVLKKVHLWVARYLNFERPLRLSAEHDEFQWLDYEASTAVVKRQYKEALMAADLVVRTFESL